MVRIQAYCDSLSKYTDVDCDTGQGAQWATMGSSLMHDYPDVNYDLEQMEHALAQLPEPPIWSLRSMYFSSNHASLPGHC
jgi:hypothetical protein